MAITIGITGGIGSGKSVVSRLLSIMNVPVYNSDAEAKRITASHPFIRKELTALLGPETYKDNLLNKPVLAAYLFDNPLHAQTVNNIIHPRVREDFRQWAARHAHFKVTALECAILIEADFARETDLVVMVYAPMQLRLERAIKRDATSREQILKRIQSQMSDEEKKNRADIIILNDGHTPLIPQVLSLLQQIQAPTKQ